MKKFFYTLLPLLLVVAGCTKDPIVPDNAVIAIASNTGSFSFEIGAKITVSATIDGKISTDINWRVASETSCVSFDKNTHEILGVLDGTATLYATSKYNSKVETYVDLIVGTVPASGNGYSIQGDYSVNNLQKLSGAYGMPTLPSLGETKLLVVPVELKDSAESQKWNKSELQRLDNTFFGEAADADWESVSSYYYKSSYGKLNITGEIAPVLMMNETSDELTAKHRTDSGDAPFFAADQFYSSPFATEEKLKEYDLDKDGLVDSVIFVYNTPESGDPFWAWVYWFDSTGPVSQLTNRSFYRANKTGKPGLSTHMWASKNFMNEGYGSLGKGDAHTFIHETGHLLGLDDYYDYDNTSSPLGGRDMMDHNIADHNPYSKMALSWIKPYYVEGTQKVTTITISTFAESEQFILLNNNWNKTALDEYLALELYTPTNLNYDDSLFSTRYTRGYTIPGVRVIHADSRVGNTNSGIPTNTPSYSGSDYVLASNSPSWSSYPTPAERKANKLTRLIQNGNKSTLLTSGSALAKDGDLFQTGNTLDTSNSVFFKNGKFNGGGTIGYKVYFVSVTATSATIQFTKL